jgi:hypothetical protein
MGEIDRDIKSSIPLFNKIVNNTFLIGLAKTAKAARQRREKKSRITARVNFKFQSLAAG